MASAYWKRKIVALLLIFLWQSCLANEALLTYVEERLPHSGTLKATERLVYVDVDDAYIHELIGLIPDFEEPPYFGKQGVGAHITVIYPDEKCAISEIEECGETIDFFPKGCIAVHPPNWKEVEEVYLLIVEAPELDRLREKYGLPARQYDFHITIGCKKSKSEKAISRLIKFLPPARFAH
jgi:Swiss Army Knife, 2H phosphoesterase domain